MHRMCRIIYNGGQSTTRLDTWSIARLYMASKSASYKAAFKLKVIETAEKCGNRAAGREYSAKSLLGIGERRRLNWKHYREARDC